MGLTGEIPGKRKKKKPIFSPITSVSSRRFSSGAAAPTAEGTPSEVSIRPDSAARKPSFSPAFLQQNFVWFAPSLDRQTLLCPVLREGFHP